MPDIRDFLPQPPWKGPPISRTRSRFAGITPSDLYSKIVSSFIKSEQLIEEAWAENKMSQVIEFHGEKLVHDVERQLAFLEAFLTVIRRELPKR